MKKSFLQNIAITLVGINVFVFILQQIIPSLSGNLSLIPRLVLEQPYLLLTHMFLHASFSHLLFNMYVLFIFGPLLEQKIGSKRFLGAYLVSGFFAALAFTLWNLGTRSMAVGASGAIMGVLGLVIMLFPNLRVLFFFVIPMKMRTAGILFALVDLVGMFGPSDGIAHIAHLGGLAFGLAYGYYLKQKQKSFMRTFTAPRYEHKSASSTKKTSSNKGKYEDAIELTKDDLDGYFKYGRL